MIITYISVLFPGYNTRYYANRYPLHAPDPMLPPTKHWIRDLVSVDSAVETWANFGDSWRRSNFSFTVPADDGAWNDITDTVIYPYTRNGKAVLVSVCLEVFNEVTEAWELQEIAFWSGVISTLAKTGAGKIQVNCSQASGYLGKSIPSETITIAEFPGAWPDALGQPIQTLVGSFQLTGGAVRALNVGDGRYLLSKNTLTGGVTAVFVGDVQIPSQYWTLTWRADGKTFIQYTPPAGVEGVPSEETTYLYCNVEASDDDNPVTCLEQSLAAAGVTFTGDASVKTELDSRGYRGAFGLAMDDQIGDLITAFCANFDCFALADNGLQIGIINSTPTATITEAIILGGAERQDDSMMANFARLSWAWDFPRNRFACEDVFIHATSVDKFGKYEKPFEFFLTRDRDTVLDVTRRRLRQIKGMPRVLTLELSVEDQIGVNIGDVISVESSKYLIFVGAHLYLVKGKTFDLLRERVVLHCQSYSDETDHTISVQRNLDGGTVSPFGLVLVDHGALNQAVSGTPYTRFALQSMIVDGTPQSGSSWTFYNITADHEVLFVFQQTDHLVQASDDGFVTINPRGNLYLTTGSNQTFTVTEKPGRYFSHWMVDGVRDETYPLTLTNITGPHTVVAHSTTQVPNTIKVTTRRIGTGTISPVPGAVNQVHIGYYPYGADLWRHYDRPANVLVNGVASLGVYWTHIKPLTQDTVIEVTFP